MDMTATIAPKSDQLNADDLISGPVTVTISEVKKGSPEQPVDVVLVEFPGRAYRPSKSMRRVMVTAWGAEASAYAGHRLTLVRNPEITFGRDKVGGIEIAAMSHIEKSLTVALTATRGKRKNFTVTPLAAQNEALVAKHLAELSAATTIAELQAAWESASKAGVASDPSISAAKDRMKSALAAPAAAE